MSQASAPYVRPEIPHEVYRDHEGVPIPYGDRWEAGPPTDAYSRVTHPERFAPLQSVARALIDHLTSTFDVAPRSDPDVAASVAAGVVRLPAAQPAAAQPTAAQPATAEAVTLAPAQPGTSRITFVFSARPGVTLLAGEYFREPYPVCACDACDDAVEDLADDLESTVFAIVRGEFREYTRGLVLPWIHAEFGAGTGGSSAGRIPARQGFIARRALRPVKRGWRAWPERVAA